MHTDEEGGVGLRSATLDRFRGNHGATGGAESKVFYAAYLYFEKGRLAEGKKKSKKREEMEEVRLDGFRRDFDINRRACVASFPSALTFAPASSLTVLGTTLQFSLLKS